MKERIVPTANASRQALDLAGVIISWNAPGHPKEYLINLPGLIGHRGEDEIPGSISSDLQKKLGEEWNLVNRGHRLEAYSMGMRDDEFVAGAVLTYFDELAALEAK